MTERIPAGPATIEISFDGVLNDLLVRLLSLDISSTTPGSNTSSRPPSSRTLTRGEPFPCWDEPYFKATFQVNLTVPSDLAAYSNSPRDLDTDLGNGQRTVSFAPTMMMSTYLVAFVVGPFEETPALDVDGVAAAHRLSDRQRAT